MEARTYFLRSLFPFLFAPGRIGQQLVLAVASISPPRPPSPTRHLPPKQVERVLSAARGDSAIARRNYAMLLTMARPGLRGQEIIAIQLDDFNWEAGEFVVRGKGRQQAIMAIPVDVGEAMVDWIMHVGRATFGISLSMSGRPSCPSRVPDRSEIVCERPMQRLVSNHPMAGFAAMSSGIRWP